MFVLTVDQRRSRRDIDRVEDLLHRMKDVPTLRPFERTAGDEVQAVIGAVGNRDTDNRDTDNGAETVVDIALTLVRLGSWSVGIGVGSVETPLPSSTRAGRGPAFEAARDAVTRAKNAPSAIAVTAADPTRSVRGIDAETALSLVSLLITDRTEQGHEAADLMRSGHTQSAAADILGISKQAMSQRLSVARWSIESSGRALAAHLLAAVDDQDRP